MGNGKVKILEEEWDYLIVLDACRYDYFEQMYREFFNAGVLLKKISLGSGTSDWLRNNFNHWSETVYITGNPMICSTRSVNRFNAKRHFLRVYDIWHTHWNEKLHTVEPNILTEQAIEITKKHPGKRVIVHYMQPHEPYLTCQSTEQFDSAKKLFNRFKRVYNGVFLLMTCLQIYDPVSRWRFFKLLLIKPPHQMYWVLKEGGSEALRKYYEENLRCVLAAVKKLVEQLDGRIVVTADHGEMLGEKGLYAHWSDSQEPILREVPWLVIDKRRKARTEVSTESEQIETTEVTKEEVAEKLRALGYF